MSVPSLLQTKCSIGLFLTGQARIKRTETGFHSTVLKSTVFSTRRNSTSVRPAICFAEDHSSPFSFKHEAVAFFIRSFK